MCLDTIGDAYTSYYTSLLHIFTTPLYYTSTAGAASAAGATALLHPALLHLFTAPLLQVQQVRLALQLECQARLRAEKDAAESGALASERKVLLAQGLIH